MFSSDVLDDPLIADGQASFSGGQVSNKSARELAENEAARLVNCDLTLLGNVVTRRGTLQLGGTIPANDINGITYYDTKDHQYLVIGREDDQPMYYNGTAWVLLDAAYPTMYANSKASFAQGIDTLYIADGGSPIQAWNGTTTTNLSSFETESFLANPAANTFPPTAPKYLAWHTNRLCAAHPFNERDAIYFSQFLEGDVWDHALWNVRVGAGEDDQITGIMSWTNFNLVVFKKRSVWLVNANPATAVSDFEIQPVHHKVGCPNPRTAAQVGGDIFFLSDSGVRSVRKTQATENQAELGEALSAPVQDIINQIDWANIDRASATFWNNRYILSIPMGGTLMYTLVYNTLTDSWAGTWQGINPRFFSYHQPAGGAPRMVFVEGTNSVREWLDYVPRSDETEATYQDNGANIETTIITRAMTFGARRSTKVGLSQQFVFEDCSTENAAIVAYLQPNVPTGFEGSVNPKSNEYGEEPKELPRSFATQGLGPFHSLQFSIYSESGKLGVSSMEGAAMVDTFALEE